MYALEERRELVVVALKGFGGQSLLCKDSFFSLLYVALVRVSPAFKSFFCGFADSNGGFFSIHVINLASTINDKQIFNCHVTYFYNGGSLTNGILTQKLRNYIYGQSPISRNRDLSKIEDKEKRAKLYLLRRQYDSRIKRIAKKLPKTIMRMREDFKLIRKWDSEKSFEDILKRGFPFLSMDKEIREITKEKKKGSKGFYPRNLGSIPLYHEGKKEGKIQILKDKDKEGNYRYYGLLGSS